MADQGDQGCVWLFGRRSVGTGLDCAVYKLYAHSVCDRKAPLQLQYAACGAM